MLFTLPLNSLGTKVNLITFCMNPMYNLCQIIFDIPVQMTRSMVFESFISLKETT